MRGTLAFVLVVTCALAGSAAARPTRDQLDARAAALRTRLKGAGFTVVVEPPFVVVGDEGARMVGKRASGILRWAITRYEADLFAKAPDKVIEIWLFKNQTTYMRGAKKYFGDEPDTPYGYYSTDADAIVMNIGPGAGTLTHEVVHPYVEADFPTAPAWFNEGLASLYEYPSEKHGHVWGKVNWRLPNLKKEIRDGTLPSIHTLLSTTSDEFYNADYDSYAFARYLIMYAQERGVLFDFYHQFRDAADDPTGEKTLMTVLGVDDLDAFQKTWEKWVLAIR